MKLFSEIIIAADPDWCSKSLSGFKLFGLEWSKKNADCLMTQNRIDLVFEWKPLRTY